MAMDYNRRNVTRDFIFYLRLCKDPMRVFPMHSIFCTKANDWLYHLVDYDCHTLKEKQLRNQYLARLVACLDAKVLVAPFLDPAIGKLEELRRHENCSLEDPCGEQPVANACDFNLKDCTLFVTDDQVFCERHRNYLLNSEKREELDAALHRLELKRNNSHSTLCHNEPIDSCAQSINDQTITQLRSIEMTLSDLTMKTKLLTNSIEPETRELNTGRRPISLRRSRSDLTKRDVTAYQPFCAQVDVTPRWPYLQDCEEMLHRHAATQRSLSPYTKEFLSKYNLNESLESNIRSPPKRSHRSKESKRRGSAQDGSSIGTAHKHPEIVAHCGREVGISTKHGCSKHSEHKSSRHSKSDKGYEHGHKRTKSPKKSHEKAQPEATQKQKLWFMDTDRSTANEVPSTAGTDRQSRNISCHRCQGTIAIQQDYKERPATHFTGEPVPLPLAMPLPLPSSGFGDGFPSVPPFPHSISELSSNYSELPDNNVNSLDYKEFNQEMEEFQRQHCYGQQTLNYSFDTDDANAVPGKEQVEQFKQVETQGIAQTLEKLTLMCQECMKQKEGAGKLKSAELSPLPNLEAILKDSQVDSKHKKFQCSSCLKKNSMSALYFKKTELQTGKFSKFTLPATRGHTGSASATTYPPDAVEQKNPLAESFEQTHNQNAEDTTTTPTPDSPQTVIAESRQEQCNVANASLDKADEQSLNITNDESRRIHYLLRCIAQERSGTAKPGSNSFLERNVNRFLVFISQFDNKSKFIKKSVSESQVRQNVLNLMEMDLKAILQQQQQTVE